VNFLKKCNEDFGGMDVLQDFLFSKTIVKMDMVESYDQEFKMNLNALSVAHFFSYAKHKLDNCGTKKCYV